MLNHGALRPGDLKNDLLGQNTHRLVTLYDAPAYVKTAKLVQDEPTVALFADAVQQLYPMHSPAATWLSLAELHDKQADFQTPQERFYVHRVKDQLTRMAEFWGIKADIQGMLSKVGASPVTPQGDADLPLRNAHEVVKAAEWLCQYRDKFAFSKRQALATKIAAAAAQFQAQLPVLIDDAIARMSGQGCTSKTAAFQAMTQRLRLRPDAAEACATAVSSLRGVLHDLPSPLPMAVCGKIAAALASFDEQFELTDHYGKDLAMPEDTLHELTLKMAETWQSQRLVTSTGTVYDRTQLEKLALADIRAGLGESFAAEVGDELGLNTDKLAAVLGSDARHGEAHMFDRVVREHGITPLDVLPAARHGVLATLVADLG